jgi:hypothetical protein
MISKTKAAITLLCCNVLFLASGIVMALNGLYVIGNEHTTLIFVSTTLMVLHGILFVLGYLLFFLGFYMESDDQREFVNLIHLNNLFKMISPFQMEIGIICTFLFFIIVSTSTGLVIYGILMSVVTLLYIVAAFLGSSFINKIHKELGR